MQAFGPVQLCLARPLPEPADGLDRRRIVNHMTLSTLRRRDDCSQFTCNHPQSAARTAGDGELGLSRARMWGRHVGPELRLPIVSRRVVLGFWHEVQQMLSWRGLLRHVKVCSLEIAEIAGPARPFLKNASVARMSAKASTSGRLNHSTCPCSTKPPSRFLHCFNHRPTLIPTDPIRTLRTTAGEDVQDL